MILALFKFADNSTLPCSDVRDKYSEKCTESDVEGSSHG